MQLTLAQDSPVAHDVAELLRAHLAFAREVTPPEGVHALDAAALVEPDIRFHSARSDGKLLAVGARKRLNSCHVELKSMHTAAPARGTGVGRAVLRHLIATAHGEGYLQLSLETGSMPAFAPARSLYRSAGFVLCGPFGRYEPSPTSVFMTLALTSLSRDAEGGVPEAEP